ncbi:MAG: tRNA pseudouridine(55) synthase TruB [Gammaproteobacteria bacterium]|nr:tRNA pseudouridine(55) synthase TruB [Gammaproteobacteria bacterium]
MTAGPRAWRPLDGLLLLDKPSGITSNAALQRARRLYQARKAGHTGSLDPLASGMLPLCFGEATKFAGYLLDADKTYLVRARFGTRTDTGDALGQTVATGPRGEVPREELEPALARFRGALDQIPPMYSALKQNGQRLYALARAGREVVRAARPVVIHEFGIEDYSPAAPLLRVRCSKGTYVRSLVEDLAASLGTTAHVATLRRLAVAPLGGERMWSLEELAEAASRGTAALDALLLPLQAILPDFPVVALDPSQAAAIVRGQVVIMEPGCGPPGGLVRLHGPGDRFFGIGTLDPSGRLAARRLLALNPDHAPIAGL